MDDYVKLYIFDTEFYSTNEAQLIQDEFLKYLERKYVSFTLNPIKYKLKFNDYLDNYENQLEICMKILKINDEIVCIRFKMVKGIKKEFKKLYLKYKEDVLFFADDTIFEDN